jgi:pimeloyl-ACP methyl ester carboxylesterase
LPENVKEELTGNSPAILADERDGYLNIGTERLATIVQPTLLVAAKDSPPEFAAVTELMAKAVPSATIEWVEGGHLINPAHPCVLTFVDEVVAGGRPL